MCYHFINHSTAIAESAGFFAPAGFGIGKTKRPLRRCLGSRYDLSGLFLEACARFGVRVSRDGHNNFAVLRLRASVPGLKCVPLCSTMRVKLKLQYDGGNYCGWQVQDGQDSLQGRLESALERLYGFKIRVVGAGRTDAGVHALGQVAAFNAPERFTTEELMRALNALTPSDIVVLEASETTDDFDPRRDACSRVYEYQILNRALPSPFHERYCWHLPQPLDRDAMAQAAQCFIGEHDFAAFRSLGSPTRSTVRRVYESSWRSAGDLLIYHIEGSSFMRHMVRTMVAAMVEVGRGRLALEAIASILGDADRAQAPAPAPARGLFLVEVRYRRS